MVTKISRPEAENWAYRADVAEQAIRNRHASPLWGIPRTNLAVVSWPAPFTHKVFVAWHYWWQAHYLECLIDAAARTPSKEKNAAVRDTVHGIRLRNLQRLAKNKYYDDRAWLAIALQRVDSVAGRRRPRATTVQLLRALSNGVDPATGVLPWREEDLFFNVPANGPAAIAFARAGRLDEATTLVDWVFDNLLSNDGLLYDGLRLSMSDPVVSKGLYSYNQGTIIGACMEISLALAERGDRAGATKYLTRVHNLIHAVAKDMASTKHIIAGAGDGDGGLFNGILARYLADAAVRLPQDDRMSRAAARIARRLVLASGESAWHHRLEVDGLPLFPADWAADAHFPQGGGTVAASIGGAVRGSSVKERDLSVQLSGWMLMEACARVAAETHRRAEEAERRGMAPDADTPRPKCSE